MKISLDGKTALVTGASRGIGKSIATRLADAGANVVFSYNSSSIAAQKIAEGLAVNGRMIKPVKVDVSDESEILQLFQYLDDSNIHLDILVNNAGVLLERPTTETTSRDFDNLMSVNLRGTFLVGRETLRRMKAKRTSGRVINISSDLGFLGRECFGVYSASKGAVNSLTKSWALEFAPQILVNAIAPGPVDTDMLDLKNMSPYWRQKEEQNPLGRIGQPEEIAGIAVYLASDEASFTTGQIFDINGGSVMR